MRPSSTTPLLLAAALAVAAPTATADVIVKLDGTRLEQVSITEETLTHVAYRPQRGGSEQVPVDAVLRVVYERQPTALGEAEIAIESENPAQALLVLSEYVDGHLSGNRPEPRFAWAPAYAQFRVVEILQSQSDLVGTAEAAQRLVESFPESRYVPAAYLAQADSLALQGKADAALAALGALEQLVESRQLSQRWRLEAGLARAILDPALDPDARINKLEELQTAAGSSFPTVVSRAQVARGEAYLVLAQRDEAKRERHLEEAARAFDAVIANPQGDAATLAGAWTGRGDCLFQRAAAARDKAGLLEGGLAYLRVTVLFPEQVRYVPKAMFLAGRCFDLIEGESEKEYARRLYGRVISEFPQSPWALEAKGYR